MSFPCNIALQQIFLGKDFFMIINDKLQKNLLDLNQNIELVLNKNGLTDLQI